MIWQIPDGNYSIIGLKITIPMLYQIVVLIMFLYRILLLFGQCVFLMRGYLSQMEWSQDLQRKLRIQEKISDLEVAQNFAKYHKDIGNEIEIQEYR